MKFLAGFGLAGLLPRAALAEQDVRVRQSQKPSRRNALPRLEPSARRPQAVCQCSGERVTVAQPRV